MGRIYQNAARVLAWLGPEGEGERAAENTSKLFEFFEIARRFPHPIVDSLAEYSRFAIANLYKLMNASGARGSFERFITLRCFIPDVDAAGSRPRVRGGSRVRPVHPGLGDVPARVRYPCHACGRHGGLLPSQHSPQRDQMGAAISGGFRHQTAPNHTQPRVRASLRQDIRNVCHSGFTGNTSGRSGLRSTRRGAY